VPETKQTHSAFVSKSTLECITGSKDVVLESLARSWQTRNSEMVNGESCYRRRLCIAYWSSDCSLMPNVVVDYFTLSVWM